MARLHWIIFLHQLIGSLISSDSTCNTSTSGAYRQTHEPYQIYSGMCVDIDENEMVQFFFQKKNTIEDLSVVRLEHNNSLTFNVFWHLRRLCIRSSNFTEITGEMFSYLSLMEILDAAMNNISKVHQLIGLESLRFLNISYNNISDTDFLVNLVNSLTDLDISNNGISNVGKISGCKHLMRINLSDNAIQTPYQIEGLTKLTHLNLARNFITIDRHAFSGLKNLMYLHLEENQIKFIPMGIFSDMQSLVFLNLSHNKIESVGFGTFGGISVLKTMDLSFNQITSLTENVLYDIDSVETLNIEHNRITEINVFPLQNIRKIYLDGNDWSCDTLCKILGHLGTKKARVALGGSFMAKNVKGIACSGVLYPTE